MAWPARCKGRVLERRPGGWRGWDPPPECARTRLFAPEEVPARSSHVSHVPTSCAEQFYFDSLLTRIPRPAGRSARACASGALMDAGIVLPTAPQRSRRRPCSRARLPRAQRAYTKARPQLANRQTPLQVDDRPIPSRLSLAGAGTACPRENQGAESERWEPWTGEGDVNAPCRAAFFFKSVDPSLSRGPPCG